MKNILSLTLLLSTLLFVLPVISFAQSGITRVRGNIYDMNNGGQGIGGLSVNVNCNGNNKTAVTDSNGLYVVDYTQAECPAFTGVSSTVTHNGETQSYTVFTSHDFRATLDFYFGSTAVPEFGAIGGVVAAVGSGLAYLGMRNGDCLKFFNIKNYS